LAVSPLSTPISRTGSATAAARPANHQLTVKFANTPAGTTVAHEERRAGDLDLDLGYGWAY